VREDLAWAAGLWEGEGCFACGVAGNASKGRTISAILSMTDQDVVEHFRDVIGFGKISQPTPSKGHKQAYRWSVHNFEKVQALIGYLYPYLGARRREKAASVLAHANRQI